MIAGFRDRQPEPAVRVQQPLALGAVGVAPATAHGPAVQGARVVLRPEELLPLDPLGGVGQDGCDPGDGLRALRNQVLHDRVQIDYDMRCSFYFSFRVEWNGRSPMGLEASRRSTADPRQILSGGLGAQRFALRVKDLEDAREPLPVGVVVFSFGDTLYIQLINCASHTPPSRRTGTCRMRCADVLASCRDLGPSSFGASNVSIVAVN